MKPKTEGRLRRDLRTKKRFNLSRYTPILHLAIEVPLVSVRTMMMGYAIERDAWQYIRLHVKVWKWRFEFDLYGTSYGRW